MKNKFLTMFFVSSIMLGLLSCSKDNKTEDKNIDIDAEHIQLDLSEKVHIDADITPYDRYKNGISSYYMDSYIDTVDKVDKEFLDENAKFFKQGMTEVLKLIESNMDGSFYWNEREIIYDEYYMEYEIKVPHIDTEGNERFFSYIWSVREDGNIGSPEVYLRNWIETADDKTVTEGSGSEHNLGVDVYDYVLESHGQDLTFAGATTTGEKYKAILEEIMGETISEDYICVAVNKENLAKVADITGNEIYKEIELDEEFYRCVFYRSIGGFSLKLLDCDMAWDGNGELASGVENQLWNDTLCARSEWPLVVDVDKNGIRFLELSAFTEVAGVYKENQKVIDIHELIEKVDEYFGVSYQVNEINIYNMELCYGAYFSDKEEGPIRNVAYPFWIVDYNIDGEQAGMDTQRLVFDGYTGEYMRTNQVK